MSDTSEVLGQIASGTTIDETWDVFCSAVADRGFDRLIYGYTQFGSSKGLGDKEDAVVLTRHDPCYVDLFIHEEMYTKGPMIRWASKNTGSCSWSYVQELAKCGELTKDEQEMLALNVQMGVAAGYTISFKGVSSRSRGALGLTARSDMSQEEVDQIWAIHGSDIELLSNVLHLKVIQLPNMNMRKQLTARQSEVLQWTAEGKTIRDIALIMDLNPATIEKHLRLAREALNVGTTAQAVMKANQSNQLFLVEFDAETSDR